MNLPRWARQILVNSTITQGVIYIVRPMITYRALELHASATMVGVIAALYALLPVLFALSFGRWVGTLGEGRFVIAGTASMVLAAVALLAAHSVALLALAAALSGLSHLACMVGGQTLVSLRSPSDQYEKYFGYYTFSASLGQMLGPIIAVLVAGSTGVLPRSTATAFAVAGVCALAALIPVWSWRRDEPTVIAKRHEEGALRSAAKLLKNKKIFAAIYTSMAISSVGDILVVFLPLYGNEKSFSAFSIGVIIALRAGASMLSRISLGRLSQRYATEKILLVSSAISVVACAAMAFTNSVLLLALVVVIAGFALGVGQPLTMSLISKTTAPQDRALAVSARLTGNRFGQFLLPAGAGLLASSSGTSAVFIALSIFLATTFIPSRSPSDTGLS
jgi:MFS family permease